MRVVGKITEQIDLFENAMYGFAVADHQPVDVVVGHSQQGIEQKIARFHADQVVGGEWSDGFVHGPPLDDGRFPQIGGGDDTDFVAILDQHRIDFVGFHRQRGFVDGRFGGHEDRRMNIDVLNFGDGEGRQFLAIVGFAQDGESLGDFLIVESGQRWMILNSLQEDWSRHLQAAGWLADHKTVGTRAFQQGAGVKDIFGAIQGDHAPHGRPIVGEPGGRLRARATRKRGVAVHLVDQAVDDEVEAGGDFTRLL